MNLPIVPVQKSGILAAGAAGVALVLVVAWQLALPGQESLNPAAALEDLTLAILFLGALACVGISFISGLVAVLRDREYALTVFLAVIFSAFGLFYSVFSLVKAYLA
jgi:ABC-type polysaccharide/polyol phosphate export permease